MKKATFLLLCCSFIMASSTVFSAERGYLGDSNIAVKAAHIRFTDDFIRKEDNDSAIYVGIERYLQLGYNLYFGGEVGYVKPDGYINLIRRVSNELTFVPIEVNFKLVFEYRPDLVIVFGAGPSVSYAKEETFLRNNDYWIEEWLRGGQAFAEINLIGEDIKGAGNFFLGIHAKYQVTEEFHDLGYNFTNIRGGVQLGYMF